MRWTRPDRWGWGLVACLLLASAAPLAAQEDAPATAETAAESGAPETIAVDDEVMALVAPIALYPDPLLAVILQASMFPVDVVQADRFLEDYQEDQTLEPSDEWDPSLIALLNYPTVLAEMNEHLDWTQAMGDAVYDQLEDVQDGVQDVRHGAYAMGVLASNEVQEVVIEEGIVQIRPTTENLVAVPDYDGAELLAALQPVGEAPPSDTAAADATTEAAVETEGAAAEDLAAREAALAQREADIAQREADMADRELAETDPDEALGEGEFAGDETYVEPAPGYAEPTTEYVETAAVDPYASSYAPAQPSYVQPPVYAAPPPPVSYSEPSSGWGTAATFVGGAAVGGLLGYAIFDDDDNGGGNKTDKSINIEDSTIVVGGDGDRLKIDKDERKRINRELQNRRDRGDRNDRRRVERRDRDRQVAALPGSRNASRDRDRRRDISLPQRDRDRPARVERRQERSAPALQAPKRNKGALANVKRPSQTKKDAQRGKKSREIAAAKRGQAPSRQLVQRGGGGKKALGVKRGGQQKAKAKSNRGKKSRGKRRG
jgi:hypothetical protein